MRKNTRITLGAAAVGLAGLVMGPLSGAHATTDPIAVPAGNELNFVGHATGTQNYTCQSTGKWGPATPEATLVDDNGTPIIHHFAGPTWQDLDDQSKVVGTRRAAKASPAGPNNIDWLLLEVTSRSLGPTGGDNIFNTTWIQRVDTHGGVHPAEPCKPGATASVPYTANYLFYTASNSQN